jgi:hypothetical protein
MVERLAVSLGARGVEMRGRNSTVVAVRLPDEVVEVIRKDGRLKGESIGLRIKEVLVELFGEGVEAVGVRTAKEI